MNKFSETEIKSFEKKLGSYHYLLTFRYSNLCVKADPMSLLPVTVTVGNMERNIEDVAEVVQMDDFHLAVMPKRMDVIRDVQEGIFEAHPEFKTSVEQMEEDQADSKFLLCEMPPVDKKRHDLLTEATKSLYEECKARMDAVLLEEKKIFVELLAIRSTRSTAMPSATFRNCVTKSSTRSKKPTRNIRKTIHRLMRKMAT